MEGRILVYDFFMERRRILWNRLDELAKKRMDTLLCHAQFFETEHYEEEKLSSEFWDWSPVEVRLRPDCIQIPYSLTDTEIQKRIMLAAHLNRSVEAEKLY